jgi:TfoX/Sxy family transcriptional regulator of competence genes
MFGYPAVFVNGNMIAGLVRDRMVIRLAADDRERFLALPGAAPFIAMKGRLMKQWAVVPPAMVKSPARLGRWLARALAHGRSLPPKPVRRPRPSEMIGPRHASAPRSSRGVARGARRRAPAGSRSQA